MTKGKGGGGGAGSLKRRGGGGGVEGGRIITVEDHYLEGKTISSHALLVVT